jgi:hypothetical protein
VFEGVAEAAIVVMGVVGVDGTETLGGAVPARDTEGGKGLDWGAGDADVLMGGAADG